MNDWASEHEVSPAEQTHLIPIQSSTSTRLLLDWIGGQLDTAVLPRLIQWPHKDPDSRQ